MELLMELPHISCVITLSQTQTHTYKSTQSHIHTPLFTSRCSLISVDQYKDPLDSGLCTQGWRFALKSHPYTLFYLLNTYTCKNAHLCSHIVHPQMHAVTYSMHACTHSHSCDVCKNKQIRITTHTCTHMLVLCSIYMHRYAVSWECVCYREGDMCQVNLYRRWACVAAWTKANPASPAKKQERQWEQTDILSAFLSVCCCHTCTPFS